MRLSKTEKQMIRGADVNTRIKYRQHKAREPYKNWRKESRSNHDSFCAAMKIPTLKYTTE